MEQNSNKDERLMIMEKKDFEKITPEEALKLIVEFRTIGGCGNSTCSECIMSPNSYNNPPKNSKGDVVGCSNDMINEFKKKAGLGLPDTDETIDTVTITPETTDIKFMIDTGYIHTLAAVITSPTMNKLCKAHSGCKGCKLHTENWSEVMSILDCGERRKYLEYTSLMLRQYDSTIKQKTSTTNVCSSCKYLHKVDEYNFCNAWKNYTSENMSCGYYQSIDK